MMELLLAPAIMVGIGLFFGIILAVSDRRLAVKEDPRIEGTNELLPGTNCGAAVNPVVSPLQRSWQQAWWRRVAARLVPPMISSLLPSTCKWTLVQRKKWCRGCVVPVETAKPIRLPNILVSTAVVARQSYRGVAKAVRGDVWVSGIVK